MKPKERMKIVNAGLADISSGAFGALGDYNGNYGANDDSSIFNYLGAEGLLTNAWTYLGHRYLKDSLFRRVCQSIPKWGVLGKFKFYNIDADKRIKFQKYLEENDIVNNAYQALVYSRLFGGGAILIAGRKSSLPLSDSYELLNEDLDLEMLPLSRWQLWGNIATDKVLRLYNTDEKINADRLIIFRSDVAPHPLDKYFMGWGASIGEHTFDSINKYYKAINKPMDYIDDAKVEVYKIADLAGQVVAQDREVIRERIKLIADCKAKNRFVMLDADDEVDFKTYSFGGLSDIMDKYFEVLCMELEETRTSLLGEQQGGFSSSDTATDIYFGKIDKWRETYRKQYHKLFRVSYAKCFGELPPEDFTYDFPTLGGDSAEKAKQKLTYKDIIDAKSNEILDSEEAKKLFMEKVEYEKI